MSEDIFEVWSVTKEELSQAILENGSLRGMVFGYVAEIKLRNLLRDSGLISALVKDDDHDRKKKGDLRLQYRTQEFRLESKSLQCLLSGRQENKNGSCGHETEFSIG